MDLVDYAVEGAVALITLDRPPVNALNGDLIGDIEEAVGLARGDSIRAVVVTGRPHFAAGADIKGFQAAFEKGAADERMSAPLGGVIRQLELLPKPVIAAVQGFALGGGLELALGADLRYLADDAKVGQPEILLGLLPGAGGTQRLTRVVGYQRAREMCMTGRQVAAGEALAMGLADKVAAPGDLLDLAMTDAQAFSNGPTQAYAAVKRAVREGYDASLEEGLGIEHDEFARVFSTADARIGVAAFLAKEKPEFTGE